MMSDKIGLYCFNLRGSCYNLDKDRQGTGKMPADEGETL